MKRPQLNDSKPSEIYDSLDMADWYEAYYLALENYADHLESKLNHGVSHHVSDAFLEQMRMQKEYPVGYVFLACVRISFLALPFFENICV